MVRIAPRKEFLGRSVVFFTNRICIPIDTVVMLQWNIDNSPSIGDWRGVQECSVKCYEPLLTPPLLDTLKNGLVIFVLEVWRIGDVW